MAQNASLNRTQAELAALLRDRLEPGYDYLRALRDLGLEPDALFWAREMDTRQFVLVLITSFFDYAGPLEVSKALFKAYNAAATPAEIDPFIVRLHSPRQSLAASVLKGLRQEIEIETDMQARIHIEKIPGTFMRSGDLEVPLAGIYKRPAYVRKTVQVGNSWKRFTRNIELLAA